MHGKLYSLHINIIQGFCSSAAGVLNEILLKQDLEVDTACQNIILYFFCVVFNLLFTAILNPQFGVAVTQFAHNFQFILVPILLLGATGNTISVVNTSGGYLTAFILKYMNVILKEYANAVEMFTNAFAVYIAFGVEPQPALLVSMTLVSASIYLYSYDKPLRTLCSPCQ